MKIALVGGTRFIGRASCEQAIQYGHDVFLLHRGVHANDVAGAESILVDRSDASAMRSVLQHLRPQVVIDMRALTRADAQSSVNAFDGLRCHVVVLSSQDVYAQFGRLNRLPAPEPEALVTEESPLTIPYPFRGIGGHSGGDEYDKKEVEAVFCSSAGSAAASVTILRLPATYGRNDYQRRFGDIVDGLDAGVRQLPCVESGRWRWTHSHVVDVAHAIMLAAVTPVAVFSVFNVGEQQTPTMRERVEVIAACIRTQIEWHSAEEVPERFALLRKMPNDFVVDSSRIREELKFGEITSEEERVGDLVSWLRQTRHSHAASEPKPATAHGEKDHSWQSH